MEELIIHEKTKEKAGKPEVRNFIRGELCEIYKLSWNNDEIIQYVSTLKCKTHVGCSCGINQLKHFYKALDPNVLSHIKEIQQLNERYGEFTATPMICREHLRGNKIYGLSDEFDVFQPLDQNNEILVNKILLDTPRKDRKKKRRELIKKYGHLINALPIRPIINSFPMTIQSSI